MAGPRDVPKDQNRNAPWQSPDVTQDVIVLNDFGGVQLEERTRTTKSGTAVRYTLGIKAEPILHNLRGLDLGRKPAQAILDLIRTQHRNIAQMAAPSTMARRRRAAAELKNGGSTRLRRGANVTSGDLVKRRYVAARTANDPPGTSARFGSDSNLLYNGWFLRQNNAEGTWTVNVPANRLDPTTFNGGLAALQRFVEHLTALIPALRGVGVLEDAAFIRAVATSSPVRVLTMTWFDKASKYSGAAAKIVSEARRLFALAAA